MEHTILSARQLNLYYGENHALKDICIQIPEHQITALIGPSGCGKSTFLRTINRMNDLIPGVKINGSLFYRGEDVYAPGQDATDLRRRIGMVFQSYELFPHMTVLDNVMLGLKGQGIVADRKSAREKLTGLAATYGLLVNPEAPVHTLSVGEQQRVEILKALYRDVSLLILDEPTAGLDPKERVRLRTLLAEMATDRIILVATHVVSDVETVATEVILLRAGKIVDAAPVPDLIDKYAPGQGLEDVYLSVFGEGDGK